MIYLDTSVLGALFFREPGSATLVSALASQKPQGLAISAWSLTEMASVGGIKQRFGAIDSTTRQQAMALFQRSASAQLALIEVDPADFRTAAVLIEGPFGLRAGDALHLAIARRLDTPLGSLDHRQIAAAEGLGIPVFNLKPS